MGVGDGAEERNCRFRVKTERPACHSAQKLEQINFFFFGGVNGIFVFFSEGKYYLKFVVFFLFLVVFLFGVILILLSFTCLSFDSISIYFSGYFHFTSF